MTGKDLAVRKETVRDLFQNPEIVKRIKEAIPRHLTPERLIRTVVAAVLQNEKLLECTQPSLLTAVMGCAQLGLAPEPFLGQAYILPFKNKNTGHTEATLIPGYRGYISLARRSGELQSVSSQVVYSNDHFKLMYGTDEKLEHVPASGDRGEAIGSYVVFHYKDGGYSFDYMTKQDIEEVRQKFSRQPEGRAWKESWEEMAKKTVIRRHVKIAPLSVEDIPRAAAMEDRAYAGESQFDMVFPEGDGENGAIPVEAGPVMTFDDHVTQKVETYPPEERAQIKGQIGAALKKSAERMGISVEDCKVQAAKDFETNFWPTFEAWVQRQGPGDPDQKIIDDFKELKTPGLMRWEKENREKISQMSETVQRAFREKWVKVIGKRYPEGAEGAQGVQDERTTEPPLSGQEPEEDSTGGEGTVVEGKDDSLAGEEVRRCPNRPMEEYTRSYCERQSCFEGCPVWETDNE